MVDAKKAFGWTLFLAFGAATYFAGEWFYDIGPFLTFLSALGAAQFLVGAYVAHLHRYRWFVVLLVLLLLAVSQRWFVLMMWTFAAWSIGEYHP